MAQRRESRMLQAEERLAAQHRRRTAKQQRKQQEARAAGATLDWLKRQADAAKEQNSDQH
jgi:hypothetical protein